MDKNQLYFGDNLPILREYIADESVDLVYLDPPFNSKADYNVLFREQDGSQASAQVKAFVDTWEWNEQSSQTYFDFIESRESPDDAKRALIVMHDLLGGRAGFGNSMIAYLSMMAPRLVQLHRVLKPTGSLYLHCDPKASHYLKILMDSIFGAKYFRNEVVWKRTFSHGGSRRFGPVHDIILFYAKRDRHTWNIVKQPYDETYLDAKYRNAAGDPVPQWILLTGTGTRDGDSGLPWRGYDPTRHGRHWAIPSVVAEAYLDEDQIENASLHEKLDALYEKGLIRFSERKRGGGTPAPRVRFEEGEGSRVQDVITDISPINSQARERLGYPTQKPEALLERIIRCSSNSNDVILDPFCGCGTAVAVAQQLGRRWIGIDVTYLAIDLIKRRLRDSHGTGITKTFQVLGEPTNLNEAMALAREENGRYQFQYWALSKLDARVVDQERKKGADRGVDGRDYFHDDAARAASKLIVYSVKSGENIGVKDIRDLKGVMEREKAAIGVFVTLHEPTKPMRDEAIEAGFYESPGWHTRHRRLQIITVADLFAGKTVDIPRTQDRRTFKKAPKRTRPDQRQMSLVCPLDEEEPRQLDPEALRAELEELAARLRTTDPET